MRYIIEYSLLTNLPQFFKIAEIFILLETILLEFTAFNIFFISDELVTHLINNPKLFISIILNKLFYLLFIK